VRRRSRRFTRRRRRRVLIGLFFAAGAITVAQVIWAVLNLHHAADDLHAGQVALGAGDFAAAEAYAGQVHDATSRAAWGTWGPQFWLMERLPVVGGNVQALRTMADVGQQLSGPVADQVVALAQLLDPEQVKPIAGRVDVGRFVAAQDPATHLAGDLASIRQKLAAVDDQHLVGPLAGRWSGFVDLVDDAVSASGYTKGILRLLPDALGRHGQRHYLVIFQNNAEFRATGGIPGAFALLTTDHGLITMGKPGVAIDLRKAEEPVVRITPEEQALYGDRLAEWPQDVNLTPDFPRTGQILRTMYQRRFGVAIDGVVSVDPVILSAVLEGTGPVVVPNVGTLTATNVTEALLNTAYVVFGTDSQQNAFFSEACRLVFQALVDGRADAGKALKGVYDGIQAGRVFAWLAAPDDQARLSGTRVAGELSRRASATPDIGVYLNDSTGTKLDFYVTSRTDVASASCDADGRQRLEVTTTLESHVPDNADVFPPLLLGNPVSDQPGDILTSVFAYGPLGSKLLDTTLDGARGSPASFTHAGHPVVGRTVLLKKGGTLTLTWTFETAPGQTGDPTLRTTPGARGAGNGAVGQSSC
jgi:hypothetical protein